jgi:RNA polymerase sigma factor (sigma-70 family)
MTKNSNNIKISAKDIKVLAEKFLNEPTNINFTKLMNRCKWGLRSYIKGIVVTNEAVDDVYSKVMEHVYFRRDSFNGKLSNFSTWLYTIAKNDSLKFLENGFDDKLDTIDRDINDSYSEFGCASGDEGENYTSNDSYLNDEFSDMVFDGKSFTSYTKEKIMSDIYDASIACMNKLPDNLRIVMHERYINRKKVDDIAKDNQIPVSSVKNWIRKGEAVLNEEVKRNYSHLYDLYMECA